MSEVDENARRAAVPLVLCVSRDCRSEDDVFESGSRLAEIDAIVACPGVSALGESIRPEERLPAGLRAAARGYMMTINSTAEPGWLSVTFTRIDLDDTRGGLSDRSGGDSPRTSV
jgi:hypothetical protein